MSSNTVGRDLYNYFSNWAKIADPGAAGTFKLNGRSHGVCVVTATGTYTLPNAPAGTTLLVVADDTSTITIADAGGTIGSFVGTSGTSGARCTALDSNSWGFEAFGTGGNVAAHDVSITDGGGFFVETNVEEALQHLGNQYTAVFGHVDIPLSSFREVDADGDVGDTAANGGVLASDTTPVFEAAGSTNAHRILWATGNADRIGASVTLPDDFDGTAAAVVSFIVASAGTTNSFNTAVLTTNWDGGADVADALTDTATTAVKAASGTVAAADIPDAPLCVTVSLTPPTHATDILYVYGCRIRYTKRFPTT